MALKVYITDNVVAIIFSAAKYAGYDMVTIVHKDVIDP